MDAPHQPGPRGPSTCHIPVLGFLIRGAVDEFSEGADGVGPHQCITPESPAVHHADVEWWVEKLILRQVLGSKGELVIMGWMWAVGCLLRWLERPAGTKRGIMLEEESWSSSSMAWEPSEKGHHQLGWSSYLLLLWGN